MLQKNVNDFLQRCFSKISMGYNRDCWQLRRQSQTYALYSKRTMNMWSLGLPDLRAPGPRVRALIPGAGAQSLRLRALGPGL